MDLADFVAKPGLPAAEDLSALCDALGIAFKINDDGKPALRVNTDSKPAGVMIAKLLSREPWRSQVIAMRLNESKPDKTPDDWQKTKVPEIDLQYATGKVVRVPGDKSPEAGHEALCWRHAGEEAWRTIPLRRQEAV